MGRYKNILSVDQTAVHFPGIHHLVSRLSPTSLDDYLMDATLYVRFCKANAQGIRDPASLVAWPGHMVNHTEFSPNTINRRLIAIKTLVKVSAAIERFEEVDALKFRAVELVKVISMRHRLKANARVRLEPEDVRRLCTLPDPTTMLGLRDRVLLHILSTSGCRISEVVSLNRGDLVKRDTGYRIEVLGKGQVEPRLAPLSREAHEWIERWLKVRDRYVKANPILTAVEPYTSLPLGHRIKSDTARLRVKHYAKQAGLPHVKPHDLRRFMGTQLAEKHGLRVAQLALGHSSPDTTARFYVLDELADGMTDGLY
jgi:site-specific recombinase XerD